jgi:hypothetical protein
MAGARSGVWSCGPQLGDTVMIVTDRFEYAADDDPCLNYCLWPYEPIAVMRGKFASVNLLYQSFEVAGINPKVIDVIDLIRGAIGRFQTVYGIKWLGDRLAWEFYFYDYRRTRRVVSINKLLHAIRPLLPCAIQANENLTYFMFSIDIDDDRVRGARELDVVHMYVGNPGSSVSSGIAYAIKPRSTALENLYFFFDARSQLQEAADKIRSSAFVDATEVDIHRILDPRLRDCHTICVANKQVNDTVYFSQVNVYQLLYFLNKLNYPPAIVRFVENNMENLDHLLYDVGFDYTTDGSDINLIKSGYYGVF